MTQITLRQLEYLTAAVELGSFTAVSRRLHVTQAAVSTALAELERGLGVSLFLRASGRGVTPTPAAVRLALESTDLIKRVDGLGAMARAAPGSLTGSVRLGCSSTFGAMVVPAVLEGLAREHPGLEVECVEDAPHQLETLTRQGVLDVTLTYERQLRATEDAVVLAEVRPHAVVHETHPLASRSGVSLAELADEPLVVQDVGDVRQRVVSLVVGVSGRMPQVRWAVGSEATVRSVVARGLAYTVGYLSQPARETAEGRVTYLPITDEVTPNRLVALTPPGSSGLAAVAVLGMLRRYVDALARRRLPGALLTPVGG